MHADWSLEECWRSSRHGAWAGRGFRFQDSAAAWLALSVWAGEQPGHEIVPEGLDDLTIEASGKWTHVQVKSRGGQRDKFAIEEVARWLKKGWETHQHRLSRERNGRYVLLLERDLDGLPLTGWAKPVSEVPEILNSLRGHIDESLLERTHLVRVSDPSSLALSLIASRFNLPEAAGWLHLLQLRRRIGDAADANASATYQGKKSLGLSDIQRLLDECTAVVDRSSLEEALRRDLCEGVNFEISQRDPSFYQGIDVRPGHVAAGLTFERPDIVHSTISGLLSKGSALIVGPSGAGKSGILWMSAFETRHSIRWYRIKRVTRDDVDPLVRFAEACRPAPDAPVGLVVDPVGTSNTSGWDQLVNETRYHANVLVIGAVREEDFFTLESSLLSHQARPLLDLQLAESLWRTCAHERLTEWAGWREPFEQSHGLLLEFMHILTRGHRLHDTLRIQVDRRLKEHRDRELQVLRYVATSHALGGAISGEVLGRLLDIGDEDVQRSLRRLIDEHLIYQDKRGRLSGLHQLRSQTLMKLTHQTPPPTLTVTLDNLILNLDGPELRAMLPNAFPMSLVADEEVIGAAAGRLRRDPQLPLLCDLVEAMGLEDCRRMALAWVRILEESRLPKLQWDTALLFVGTRSDPPELFGETLRQAVRKMSEYQQRLRLRQELVDHVDERVWHRVFNARPTSSGLIRVLQCLGGLRLSESTLATLRGHEASLSENSILELSEVISAARAVSERLTDGIIESHGGPETLLQRIQTEVPWCRDLKFVYGQDGIEVHGKFRYVSQSRQSDPHKDVVGLCALVSACIPTVAVVQIESVDAFGRPAEPLHPDLCRKRIPRANLPEKTAVAWNRVQHEIANRVIASSTITERQTRIAQLLRDTVDVVQSVGDKWVLGEQISQDQERGLRGLRSQLSELGHAGSSSDAPQLGKPGVPHERDVSGSVFGAIANNLIPRLFGERKKLMSVSAFAKNFIGPDLNRLRSTNQWTYLEDVPRAELQRLESLLHEIADIALELSMPGIPVPKVLRGSARRRRQKGRPLARAAAAVRVRARQRFDRRIEDLRTSLNEAGATIHVVTRPPDEDHGILLPNDHIGVLVIVADLAEWFNALPVLISTKHEIVEEARGFSVVPVLGSKILDRWSGRIVTEYFPTSSEFASWPGDLPFEILQGRSFPIFMSAVGMLRDASSVLSESRDSWHSQELDVAASTIESFRIFRDELLGLANMGGKTVIQAAVALLDRMGVSVQDQWNAIKEGNCPSAEVAGAFLYPGNGADNALMTAIVGLKVVLTEWDLDPKRAEKYLTHLG